MGGNTQKGVQAQAVKMESRVPATLDSKLREPLKSVRQMTRTSSNFSAMKPQSSEANLTLN